MAKRTLVLPKVYPIRLSNEDDRLFFDIKLREVELGWLKGKVRIGATEMHVDAIRVIPFDGEEPKDGQARGWQVWYGSGRPKKHDSYDVCCQKFEDCFRAIQDYDGSFSTTTIPGARGEWVIWMTPFLE